MGSVISMRQLGGKRVWDRRQRGVVLITGVVLLWTVSLLAVSMMGTSRVDQQITHYLRNNTVAVADANEALQAAELWLRSQSAAPVVCNALPCEVWEPGLLPDLAEQDVAWWSVYGVPYTASSNAGVLAPRYVIEAIAFVPDGAVFGNSAGVYYYRITACGYGRNQQGVGYVQSVYAMRYS